jgi:hypothetical protein
MICMLAFVVFGIPLLRVIKFPGEAFVSAPGMPAAAGLGAAAVAIAYAIQMAWMLLRQRDTGERIPHGG